MLNSSQKAFIQKMGKSKSLFQIIISWLTILVSKGWKIYAVHHTNSI